VGITPFVAAAVCLFFIRALTKPIKILLDATRRLKRGDLDFKIKGLKNEFGELARSFNGMSDSLHQTMHKIQESENRYRTLFESAGDAIFILETEGENIGDILEANRAAAEMHGISIEKLLTLNLIKDLDAPDAAEQAPGRFQRILKGETFKAELNHRKEDGTIFPVEVSGSLLEYMGHKYILAIGRDVSGRKEMENMILQSKLEWENTFNTITDVITIHDMDFNIIRANKAAKKMLGLPDLNINQAKCYQYYHGKDSPPDECPSCECFKTEKQATFEMYEPHLDKFLEVRAMPRFDSNHQMIGLIHVVRDITERKGVETSLQRTEQLKMVGEMAAGLAHEIKNPLAGIKGSLQCLVEEESISEEDRDLIVKSVDQIKRIELLIKGLLNFAKPPQLQLMLTDINDLLEKTISFSLKSPALASDSSTSIAVKKDFEQGIPETMADPMQLQQVVLNLMLNAIEAMPDGGILTVKTSYDAERSIIRIAIADTGKGMDKDMQEKIFQPFFTTKPKGSGLGLAITRRLIEQHGGDICVESTLNKGTVFNISLQMQPEEKEQIA
jgi:PAS domain S-box-containing protein